MSRSRLLVLGLVAILAGGCARPPAAGSAPVEALTATPVAAAPALPPCDAALAALGSAIGTAEYLVAHPIAGMGGSVEQAIATLQAVERAAPKPRRGDIQGVVRVLTGVASAVGDESRSARDIAAQLQALAPTLNAPAFREAVDRVRGWLRDGCAA